MTRAQPEPRDEGAHERGIHPAGLVLGSLGTGLGLALPLLRAFGVIEWPWMAVLAPFTVLGMFFTAALIWMLAPQGLTLLRARLGGDDASLTPPPDNLEVPEGAPGAGDGILAHHPEILAAICHGMAHRALLPRVLNCPTSDPWGVYQAALEAGPKGFEELRVLASQHARRFAKKGRGRGRLPSDSRVLKQAVRAFHLCAKKSQAGHAPVGCTFEHVTQIYGSLTPARDGQLKSIAPKVRMILEREYPQLSTATLTDGSSVKYEQWREEAARDREELATLRREYERMTRRVEEVQEELTEAHAGADRLRESMEAFRTEARKEARAVQEERVGELHRSLETHQKEQVRQLNRFEAMRARLEESITALTAERDDLEQALFDAVRGEKDESVLDPATVEKLAGLRVLLVGGHEGQIPPIRKHLESLGVQLSHADGPVAVDQVGTMHTVVLWIRFVAHPTVWAVKPECRAREIPCLYWSRTSPESLAGLIAERVGAAR